MDFLKITLLQGNDYLPKIRKASMDLWFSYLKLREESDSSVKLLNDNFSINWKLFLQLLTPLNREIPNIVRTTKNLQIKFKPKHKFEKSLNSTENYLQGFIWCNYMYNTGCCPDFNFEVDSVLAPTMREICFFYLNNKFRRTFKPVLKIKANSFPIPPILYSLAVIPLEASDCFAPAFLPLTGDINSPIHQIIEQGYINNTSNFKKLQNMLKVCNSIPKSQKRQIFHCSPSVILFRDSKSSSINRKFVKFTNPYPPISSFTTLRVNVNAVYFDHLKSRE